MRRRAFLLGMAGLSAGWFLFPTKKGRAADEPLGGQAPSPSVLLAVGGDVTLGANLQTHAESQLAAGIPKEQLWPLYVAGVKPPLGTADLTLVNLEGPLTERGEKLVKRFNFRARPELVDILKAGPVQAVTLANNHTMDYGAEGLEDTLAALDAAGITHCGAGKSLEDARQPVLLERAGMKIGVLGYYYQSAANMLEPPEMFAASGRSGVAGCYTDLACLRDQIAEDVPRLAAGVDAAFVYFHWGKEGSTEAQAYQVDLAHLCIDFGCKGVFGAHPHRVQGVELYRDRPIFYSLGNFLFGGNKDPRDKLGALATVRIFRTGSLVAEIIPIQSTRWPEAPFQPQILSGEDREAALARIASLSEGFPKTLPMLQSYAGRGRKPG